MLCGFRCYFECFFESLDGCIVVCLRDWDGFFFEGAFSSDWWHERWSGDTLWLVRNPGTKMKWGENRGKLGLTSGGRRHGSEHCKTSPRTPELPEVIFSSETAYFRDKNLMPLVAVHLLVISFVNFLTVPDLTTLSVDPYSGPTAFRWARSGVRRTQSIIKFQVASLY